MRFCKSIKYSLADILPYFNTVYQDTKFYSINTLFINSLFQIT